MTTITTRIPNPNATLPIPRRRTASGSMSPPPARLGECISSGDGLRLEDESGARLRWMNRLEHDEREDHHAPGESERNPIAVAPVGERASDHRAQRTAD